MTMRKRFTAFVVFQGADHRRWWRIFTRRGWRHCYLIIPAYYPEPGLRADAYSQVVNCWTDSIRCDVIWLPPREVADRLLADGVTCVVELPIDQKFTGRYLPRGLLTCVSLTKAMLCIDAWWVWTPEQLCRWMLQHGGQLVRKSK